MYFKNLHYFLMIKQRYIDMYYYIGNSVHSHLRNLVVRKEECKETLKEYIYFDK